MTQDLKFTFSEANKRNIAEDIISLLSSLCQEIRTASRNWDEQGVKHENFPRIDRVPSEKKPYVEYHVYLEGPKIVNLIVYPYAYKIDEAAGGLQILVHTVSNKGDKSSDLWWTVQAINKRIRDGISYRQVGFVSDAINDHVPVELKPDIPS